MSTYRQLTYMVLDELKGMSDDFTYTTDHALFLLNKYRGMLLKQLYSDIKKQIPESNYQTICLELTEVPSISGEACEGSSYLRSKETIPDLILVGSPSVNTLDYYGGDITFVSRERMRYVGHNRFLQNIIYASLAPDHYLYFKSANPLFLYLEKVKLTGIFEDPEKASELECDKEEGTCDIMDSRFPLEEALIPQVVQLVVKELSGAIYKPKDPTNNAADDLSDIQAFIRRNTKSALLKQIEDD